MSPGAVTTCDWKNPWAKISQLENFPKKQKKRLFSRLCWHCPTSFNSKDCRRITKSSTSLGFGAVQVAGSNLNFWGNISLAHKATHNKATTMRTSVDIGWQYELWIYFYLILILVCYISIFVPSPNTITCFFSSDPSHSISIFDLPSAHTERMEFLWCQVPLLRVVAPAMVIAWPAMQLHEKSIYQ